ncbi:transposase [Vagococcus silagei]|uniref:Transposase IS4-like domain-containing protein n=1 Tax=Vagococcus silagei TaxID=2508885 RepID=A0A4S3B3E4_9ENTE|nr:transposase [Vagococcus silagei]THB61581.1 hypothetical protein ESZ54_03765 [Vagococcus silagei]
MAVSSTSQYLLSVITTSASIADVSMAIPMMRELVQLMSKPVHILIDKSYDASAVYEEAHRLGFEPFIDLKKLSANDGETDKYVTPTCLIEESYR